jgi:hypothetical protein
LFAALFVAGIVVFCTDGNNPNGQQRRERKPTIRTTK